MKTKVVQHARRGIDFGEQLRLTGLVVGSQTLEQKSVVARFDADDVMRAGRTQVIEMRSVGAERVLLPAGMQATTITGKWRWSRRKCWSQRRVALRSQSILVLPSTTADNGVSLSIGNSVSIASLML